MIEARRGSKSMPKRIAAGARLADGTARSGAAPSIAPVCGNLGRRGHALGTVSAINRRRRRPFAGQAAVRQTDSVTVGQPQFDGPERAVHVRTAEHAGHIYLDLADEHWRAVDIGPDGWRVTGCPPVRFRRPAGTLPLPVPQQGGSIESLNSFLNLVSRDDFVLIVAWLLAALRSGGPYPLLAISGEQGSAKTVLSKMLKALVDPNAAPVRALPREERELMIAANSGYLLAFDNLSGLPVWLSDAPCRLASGGSFASIPTTRRCCLKRHARSS